MFDDGVRIKTLLHMTGLLHEGIFHVGGVLKPYRRCGQSSIRANPAEVPRNFLRELVEGLGCVGRTSQVLIKV